MGESGRAVTRLLLLRGFESLRPHDALVAQRRERGVPSAEVAGSIPAGGAQYGRFAFVASGVTRSGLNDSGGRTLYVAQGSPSWPGRAARVRSQHYGEPRMGSLRLDAPHGNGYGEHRRGLRRCPPYPVLGSGLPTGATLRTRTSARHDGLPGDSRGVGRYRRVDDGWRCWRPSRRRWDSRILRLWRLVGVVRRLGLGY